MAHDQPQILVVDDEENICLNCRKILSKVGYSVTYTLNGYDALAMLEKARFDLVITDLKMSRLGGMEVLHHVKSCCPDTLVIVITGYASVSSAVEVMKMGAFDYLPKPFTPHELRAVVQQALEEREIRMQNRRLRAGDAARSPISHQLIGGSPKMRQVVRMIGKVAPTDATVLIYGESGTGKELVARALHANSGRRRTVFFAVDCGTLSAELLESELFGHTKGAFTGAHQDKDGIFTRADGGTVFLDEISNINPEVQSKLLRFLETREFLPRGAAVPRRVDVRLIFATNRDLHAMVADGTFRQDFYYRIYVYPINLPPLRDRKSDILPIAYHFLRQYARSMGKAIGGISGDAAGLLMTYDWPGNVRQLRNVVERAVILCEGDQITLRELPMPGVGDGAAVSAASVPATNEELKRMKKEIRRTAVAGLEKKFILNALSRSDWNVTRAAKAVGLQRTNFQSMMKKHGISRPGSGQRPETAKE